MSDSHSLYLVSKPTKNFPKNKSSKFSTELFKELNFCKNYRLCLKELILPPLKESDKSTQLVYITTNLVAPTQIGEKFHNLIKICPVNRTKKAQHIIFSGETWTNLRLNSFRQVEIEFKDYSGKILDFEPNSISSVCILFKTS
jgi:hypothetical protein